MSIGNRSQNPRASLLVLQTESVLLKFDGNTLPLSLETNEVCNCVCLILFSQEKGMAYLAHIDLADLGEHEEGYLNYSNLIGEMVGEYGLNSSNTFVALVGAQDRTLTHLSVLKSILFRCFTAILDACGGSNCIERCIQLSNSGLEHLTITFKEVAGERRKVLAYYQHPFDANPEHSEQSNLHKVEYHRNGKKRDDLDMLNAARVTCLFSSPDYGGHVQKLLMSTLPLRRKVISGGVISYSDDYLIYKDNLRLSVLRDAFDLTNDVTKNSNRTFSDTLFYCAILRDSLFKVLKDDLGLEGANKLSYAEINYLRFPSARRCVKEGRILIDQIIALNVAAKAIICQHDYCLAFLVNNMEPAQVLSLTGDDERIRSVLLKLHQLTFAGDVSEDQISSMTFDCIESMHAYKKQAALSSVPAAMFTGEKELNIEKPFNEPSLKEVGCCIS
jgi:hypothetical protein